MGPAPALSLGGCAAAPQARARERSPAGSSTAAGGSRPPVPMATPPLYGKNQGGATAELRASGPAPEPRRLRMRQRLRACVVAS